MNAPIFFMNMISPLQKIITVLTLRPGWPIVRKWPIKMFLIISTVHSLFVTILHQEIVLIHDPFSFMVIRTQSIWSWSTVLVTCGHFRSPKCGFDESEYDSEWLSHSNSINTVNKGLVQIKKI